MQTLCLRHRGSGKLPVAVAALPASLKMLAFKKLMLYGNRLYTLDCTDCAENGVLLPAEMQQSAPLGTQGADAAVGHDALELHDVECHAITSPDFQQRAATGMLSRAASAADALSVSMLDSRSTGVLVGSTKSEFEARSGHNCVALPSPNAQLPNLSSLHLRNCLISDGAARHLFGATAECSRADVGCQTATHHLTCLAVTGDSGSEELASGLSTWLTQLSSLQGLQVSTGTACNFISAPCRNHCIAIIMVCCCCTGDGHNSAGLHRHGAALVRPSCCASTSMQLAAPASQCRPPARDPDRPYKTVTVADIGGKLHRPPIPP